MITNLPTTSKRNLLNHSKFYMGANQTHKPGSNFLHRLFRTTKKRHHQTFNAPIKNHVQTHLCTWYVLKHNNVLQPQHSFLLPYLIILYLWSSSPLINFIKHIKYHGNMIYGICKYRCDPIPELLPPDTRMYLQNNDTSHKATIKKITLDTI